MVLDRNYQAFTVVGAKRAICLVVSNRAEVVNEGDTMINSPTVRFNVPTVIRLLSYVFKWRNCKMKLTSRNVMARDGYRCQYCGSDKKSDLTIDHIIPTSRGGKNTWTNMTTACFKCNTTKDSRTLAEAKMTLINKPYVPALMPILMLREHIRNASQLMEDGFLFYWRKHHVLHDWFGELFKEKGGKGIFEECDYMELTLEDLEELEPKIQSGDFSCGLEEDIDNDMDFINQARKALTRGYRIFYTSWC